MSQKHAIIILYSLLFMSLIIGFIGDKLAGKDLATKYLEEHHNGKQLRYSYVLDVILELLDEPVSREAETKLAQALRATFNENVLGQGMLKMLRESKSPLIALDGIRYPAEIPPLQALGAHIVYITAPVELRYERYTARQEKADDGKLDFEEFKRRDGESSNEVHIAELGSRADLIIHNIGTLEELYAKLDAMVAQWQ